MIELRDVTLAVLAGGAGRRMGGPKAWLTFEGEPILERLHRRLHWPGPTLLISSPGREHPPGSVLFDTEVCDEIAGQGPLRGIYTALANASTPWVVVTPVDMPFLDRPMLESLVFLADQLYVIAACYRMNGSPKPLPVALQKSLADRARQSIEQQKLGVHRWLQSFDTMFVEPSQWPKDCWTNLNEPGDLGPI